MKKRPIVALIAIASLSSAALAEAPAGLDPRELIAKSIDATGGKEKLLSVKSMSVTGTVAMPAQDIKGTIEMHRAPGKAVVTIAIPDITSVRSGFVGDVAYESSELLGSRLLNDTEKRRLLDGLDPQAQFDRVNNMKDLKAEPDGKIGDIDVIKISGTNVDGDAEAHWIDAKKYLTLKSQVVIHSQMGKMPATIEFGEFKTIDGITLATVMKQNAVGTQMIATLSDIKINNEIPDATFAIPAEVQKLIDKQANKPAATRPAEKP